MKRAVLFFLAMAPVAAGAQSLDLAGTQQQPVQDQTCTTVQVGSTVSYGCINRQQQALVAQQKANQESTQLNQNSPPQALGLYNQAATKEHLGSNFGKSSLPQGTGGAVYRNPIVPPK